MLRKSSIIAIFLILGIGIALTASSPDVSIEETETSTVITGTVSDVETGDAIQGAEVTLHDTEDKATTDETGTFTFDSLEAGTYTLSASARGYKKADKEVNLTEEGANVAFELSAEW